MDDVSRRTAVGVIGVTMGSFGSYKVRASVAFAGSAAPVGRKSEASAGGWQPLNLASNRYPMMPVRINGNAVPALVDTGASRSVIKQRLAERLGLRDRGAVSATTFTKEVTGRLYAVPQIAVGSVRLTNLLVASYSAAEIEQSIDVPIDFVLGRDVLQCGILEMDFPRDRARFASGRNVDEHASAIELSVGNSNLVSVPLGVESHENTFAIVDLGSTLPISISSQLAGEWGLLQNRRSSTTMTVGVEGAQESVMVSLTEVRLGRFGLRNVPTCIVDDWKLSRQINIGWPLLASFECAFDFGAGKLWLTQDPGLSAQELSRDRSGIGASRLPDQVLIRHIARNSPAKRAGLKPGDAIIRIAGKAVSPAYPAPGERFGAKASGTVIDLGLADGRTLSITLEDYF